MNLNNEAVSILWHLYVPSLLVIAFQVVFQFTNKWVGSILFLTGEVFLAEPVIVFPDFTYPMLYSDLDTGNFFVIPELPVYVTSVDQLGTSSYLATKDGQILMEGIQHIRFVAFNDSESFQSMNANGDVIKNEGSVSCKNEAIASNLNIQGIIALIKILSKLVPSGSELAANLIQMEDCTQDLLGLLNSILDTGKIEVGKMELKEEEFDLSHFLEEVVDIYYLVAMEKGVELVLDSCNGSVIKYSHVKGDRGRLKQVRLMHGDIEIVDKNIGEKGTCLSARGGLEYGTSSRNKAQGRTIHSTISNSNICSTSPMLHICNSSPRLEASRVVLFIGNKERMRTCKRFMKSLGIKVNVVNCQEDLFDPLEEIKQKGRCSGGPSSPESSFNLSPSSHSTSHNSFSRTRGVPLSSMDGNEYTSPVFKKTNVGIVPGFVLIVIDANATVVTLFGWIIHRCNIVWLDSPHLHRIDAKIIDQNDIVILKPFHGSHLFQFKMLLPGYSNGSAWQRIKKPHVRKSPVRRGEIQESTNILASLGATVEQCENGEEAVRLVDEGLKRDYPNLPYDYIDYILMDCQMSVMNGFEATRQIREMEKSYGVHNVDCLPLLENSTSN
ncbi:histidine kinase [Trifolium repens]|nr:histidine kinase [Trifolium repens]